ncbi:hypothetical protein GEMRC1_006735 [Eukaryota sp. GEM-RC1]
MSFLSEMFNPEHMRGPCIHNDYWTSVHHLRPQDDKSRSESGLLDHSTYRHAIDRPSFVLPSILHYLLLFFMAPIMFPFNRFRRLTSSSFKYKSPIADEIHRRMRRYKFKLKERKQEDEPIAKSVDVFHNGECLVENVLNPRFISGYCSLFFATYKVPIAILFSTIVTFSLLASFSVIDSKVQLKLLQSMPLLLYPLCMVILKLLFKDWFTSIVGSVPVIVGRLIFPWYRTGDVTSIVLASVILLCLYFVFNSFFLVRPAPPSLMLFVKDGPLSSYSDMENDGPYWLKSNTYWVFRQLLVVSGEVNKPWEKDWERVELWINADVNSPNCGMLEYVVTDVHYRELWIPANQLIKPHKFEFQKEKALEAIESLKGGMWKVEVDADVVFHTPLLITVSFVPFVEGHFPAQQLKHLTAALFKQEARESSSLYMLRLEKLQLDIGREIFSDCPEWLSDKVSTNMMSIPFRWWRYPYGCFSKKSVFMYSSHPMLDKKQHASDPLLQLKAPIDES